MSIDENGILYAASENSAIYRLFPWSDSFEMFAGTTSTADDILAHDGPRIGTDSCPIVGPVSSIDAIGNPGYISVLDQGRNGVIVISAGEGGLARKDFNFEVNIRYRFVTTFPDADMSFMSCTFLSDTWSKFCAATTRFFHPFITTITGSTISKYRWCHSGGSTFSTFGRSSSRISDSLIHPLATLSPQFMLCVNDDKKLQCASLGVTNVPTTSDYHSITSSYYPIRLHGNWKSENGESNTFLFAPSTNMLYAWNGSSRVLTRYYNLVTPSPDFVGLKESPFSKPGLKFDLSALRPTLLSHDFQLESKNSKQIWNIHTDLLAVRLPTASIPKLSTIIQKFPDNSITAFVDFLYFKPLVVGTDWISSMTELCHVIFLCEALDVKCSEALVLFESLVEAHLSPVETADILFQYWFDPEIEWSASSAVINVLARKAAKIENARLLEQTGLYPLTSCRRAMELAFKLTSIGSWKLQDVHDSSNIALPDPSSRILIDPKLALQFKTDYIFGANHHWTIAKGWILFPRWSWFKRLIDSGMEESKTRVVSMPPWVTVNIMHAIIKTVYQQNTGSVPLSEEEMTLILEKGSEIGLVDSSKYAITPFDSLIGRCNAMLLHRTTKFTCKRMLVLYHRLQLKAELESTLMFIKDEEVPLQLHEFAPDLRKLLEA